MRKIAKGPVGGAEVPVIKEMVDGGREGVDLERSGGNSNIPGVVTIAFISRRWLPPRRAFFLEVLVLGRIAVVIAPKKLVGLKRRRTA